MGVVELGDEVRVAQACGLTIRQIPVYWVRTYLNAVVYDCDEDILEFQTEARKVALSRNRSIGRLHRKIQWLPGADQHIAQVCWYWDLDG